MTGVGTSARKYCSEQKRDLLRMRLLLLPAFFMQRGGQGECRPVRPAYLYYLYSYPAAIRDRGGEMFKPLLLPLLLRPPAAIWGEGGRGGEGCHVPH